MLSKLNKINKKMLTTQDVMFVLNKKVGHVRNLLINGNIKSYIDITKGKTQVHRLVHKKDLEEYIKNKYD